MAIRQARLCRRIEHLHLVSGIGGEPCGKPIERPRKLCVGSRVLGAGSGEPIGGTLPSPMSKAYLVFMFFETA